MYPLHQTVLLNTYFPPKQPTFLKQCPTIDEEMNENDTRKFASLNTRAVKKPPRFQSMRLIKKRNIERFYPNTEYGENFTEINNNKNAYMNNKEVDDNIYENFPSLLNTNTDISGIEQFENLTDSIQIYEESIEQLNDSTNSLSRPIPAPRTKITPLSSPIKTDHVYVNLSMPLINTKYAKSFDTIDAAVRPTKSAENLKTVFNDDLKEVRAENESESEEEDSKMDIPKPNIVGATPKKNLAAILPSTSLVKSVVNQLKEQGINKVALPKKQVITPDKTLQIPKLSEKPIPKRSVVRRSSSVQSSLTADSENGQVYAFSVLFFYKLYVPMPLCVNNLLTN